MKSSQPQGTPTTSSIEESKDSYTVLVANKENHDIKSLLMGIRASLFLLEKRVDLTSDDRSQANFNRLKTQMDTLTTLLVAILEKGR